jgi:hypothetical protein
VLPSLTVVHKLTTLAASNDITQIAIDIKETGETVQELRLSHFEQQVLKWLSAPDPSTNYINALKRRHEGTGAWFTGGRAFNDWKKQSKSFLWLHGNPGCGKTVLSSTIIEHLGNVATPDQVLLYFYFDFSDTNKQTLGNMLRSLVNQLYQRQPKTRALLNDLREILEKDYLEEDYPEEDYLEEDYQKLSEQILRDILLLMLSKVDDVSIILDALDESSTITDLLAWLRSVLETQSIACRILVTARRQKDIESVLQHWMRPEDSINIHHGGIQEDIRAYIHHMVRNSEELERWQGLPEVQDKIETRLMEKSDGM